MKSLIFLIVVMAICVFGIMLVGVVVYIAGEAFGYLAWGVPVSFDKVQIMRLFRMCLGRRGVRTRNRRDEPVKSEKVLRLPCQR